MAGGIPFIPPDQDTADAASEAERNVAEMQRLQGVDEQEQFDVVKIVDPKTGRLGTVPRKNLAAAQAKGYEEMLPGHTINITDGARQGTVPAENLKAAIAKGYKPVEGRGPPTDAEIDKEAFGGFGMGDVNFAHKAANTVALGLPDALLRGKVDSDAAASADRAFAEATGQNPLLGRPSPFDLAAPPEVQKLKSTWKAFYDQAEESDTGVAATMQRGFQGINQQNRAAGVAGNIAGALSPAGPFAEAAGIGGAAGRGVAEAIPAVKALEAGGRGAQIAAGGIKGAAEGVGATAGVEIPEKLSDHPLGTDAFVDDLKSAGLFALVGGALGGSVGAFGRALASRPSLTKARLAKVIDAVAGPETEATKVSDYLAQHRDVIEQMPEIRKTIDEMHKAERQGNVQRYSQAELQLKIDLDQKADNALAMLLPKGLRRTPGLREGELYDADLADLYDPSQRTQMMASVHPMETALGGVQPPTVQEFAPGTGDSAVSFLASKNQGAKKSSDLARLAADMNPSVAGSKGAAAEAQALPAGEGIDRVVRQSLRYGMRSKEVDDVVDQVLQLATKGKTQDEIAQMADAAAQRLRTFIPPDGPIEQLHMANRAATIIEDRLATYREFAQMRDSIVPSGEQAAPQAYPGRYDLLYGKLDRQREAAARQGSQLEGMAPPAEPGRLNLSPGVSVPGFGPPRPAPQARSQGSMFKDILGDAARAAGHAAVGGAIGGLPGAASGILMGGIESAGLRVMKYVLGRRLAKGIHKISDIAGSYGSRIDAAVDAVMAPAPGKLNEALEADVQTAAKEGPTLLGKVTGAFYGGSTEPKPHDSADSLPGAVQQKAEQIAAISADPARAQALMRQRLAPVALVDPKLVESTIKHWMERIQFLAPRMPQWTATPFNPTPPPISPADAAKAARYIAATEDPVGQATAELKAGVVTPETAETLRTLFAPTMQYMREKIFERVAKDGKPLSYTTRLAMTEMFAHDVPGIPPIEPSVDPQFAVWYSQTMQSDRDAKADEQQPGDRGGFMPKRKIDMGNQTRGTLGQRLGD